MNTGTVRGTWIQSIQRHNSFLSCFTRTDIFVFFQFYYQLLFCNSRFSFVGQWMGIQEDDAGT